MSAKARNGLSTPGRFTSTWHLLTCPPNQKEIPKTHRYREISHEEFRILSRYLDAFRSQGKIIVTDALDAVVLHRLTGLKVDQSGWRWPGKYEYNNIPKNLGENDHVLVSYGTVYGIYVQYSYAKADPGKFKQMVVTGLIEPKSKITYPSPSELMVIAEHVGKNQQRISEAQKLLETALPDTRESLIRLINEFKERNDHEITQAQVTPRIIDNVLAGIEEELRFLSEEHRKNRLLLEIDNNLDLDRERRTILRDRVEAINQNIVQHQNTIANLKALREYVLTSIEE